MRYNLLGVVGELDTLPGCSQIAVSHGVFLPTDKRGHGLGTAANQARKKLAFDELGYDAMICTVAETNAAQKRVLSLNGWTKVRTFWSSKTSHYVELWWCQKSA